jgi:hypothetical protein
MALLNHLFSLSRSISSTIITFIHPLVYSVSSSSYFLSLLIDQTSTNHHSPARRHPIKRKRCYSMFPSLIPVLSSTHKLPEELWTNRPIPHIQGERKVRGRSFELLIVSRTTAVAHIRGVLQGRWHCSCSGGSL